MIDHTGHDLKITRTFGALPAVVFDAWTNPKSDTGWWGPKAFTLLFDEKDLKAGGSWRMGMSRKGEIHVSRGAYREINKTDRLVMTHAWEDASGKLSPETLITINLDKRNGTTEMTFVQTGFEDAATRDGHREGWTEAFDALVTALGRQKAIAR